jgi:NADH-quinone oxidoreductase subunit L
VLYTVRLLYHVFEGEERFTKSLSLEDPPSVMRVSMLILAVGSAWFTLSVNPFDYSGWVYQHLHPGKDFHLSLMPLISFAWVALALTIAFFWFRKGQSFSSTTLSNGFYWDRFLNFFVASSTLQLSTVTSYIDRKWIDRAIHFTAYVQVTVAHLVGWFDSFVVDGMVNAFAAWMRMVGSFTRSFQGGKIQLYIFWATLTIIIFLIWILF